MRIYDNLRKIAQVCGAEVQRQQAPLTRVADLIGAYQYAADHCEKLPTTQDMLTVAGLAEPDNKGRYRTVPVTFANGSRGVAPELLPTCVPSLFDLLDTEVDPGEFVHEFLRMHPFVDGNGRTAFVLFNWISGTLLDPSPLPKFY